MRSFARSRRWPHDPIRSEIPQLGVRTKLAPPLSNPVIDEVAGRMDKLYRGANLDEAERVTLLEQYHNIGMASFNLQNLQEFCKPFRSDVRPTNPPARNEIFGRYGADPNARRQNLQAFVNRNIGYVLRVSEYCTRLEIKYFDVGSGRHPDDI
jgi:hypothetical protein